MSGKLERRRCNRFEIPDAFVRYQKRGVWKMLSHLSDRRTLLNLSKGGMCFNGKGDIHLGDKVTVYLCLSNGVRWPIKGTVVRKSGDEYFGYYVGVVFAAYKKGHGYNDPEILDVLRSLESTYLDSHNELRRSA